MPQQMNGNSQTSKRPQSAVGPPVRAGSWYERIMAALVCGSEFHLRQLNALLRTGLGMVFFFEVATWMVVARFESTLLYTERPFFIFDIVLVGAALCLTYCIYGRLPRGKKVSGPGLAMIDCKHLFGVTTLWCAQMGNPLTLASTSGRPRGPL